MSRLLPLILFLLLGVLLAFGLYNAENKSDIPSPLIGKNVPEFNLPLLYDPDQFLGPDELAGQPYLVNFWASWCVTCRVEHPVITELAQSNVVRIIGMNFRDAPEDAVAWLQQYGDPYDLHLADRDGRVSIDFGVYAAPETFLVDQSGTIVFKHLGAVTREIVNEEILPRLQAMKAADS